MSSRLTLALDAGDLLLPAEGAIRAILPRDAADLAALPRDRLTAEQPLYPQLQGLAAQGIVAVPADTAPCAVAVVFLPRAKAQARAVLHAACTRATDLVVIDGAKTDGVDSILRDLKGRLPVLGSLSKAHGKLAWFRPDAAALADWAQPGSWQVDGFHTAPGVFSADGIDPASRMLADHLPPDLGRKVVDLGAGWGYLAARILGRGAVAALDLVEADHAALDCARRNVTDPRARFHWADALTWRAPAAADTVVMNPPFHSGRATDPDLGRGFIQSAARLLAPAGRLFMVANRHLPYEATLTAAFAETAEIGGDSRFKILLAARPKKSRPGAR